MSVIHEALRRARESRAPKNKPTVLSSSEQPAVTVRSAGRSPSWVWWLMLFFILAEGILYFRERNIRLHSQDKMRSAYLELNDARGDYLQKMESEGRVTAELMDMKKRLNEAQFAKSEIEAAKQHVEYDNINKEKKISQLTKELHSVEMDSFRAEEENHTLRSDMLKLKAELAILRSSSSETSTK